MEYPKTLYVTSREEWRAWLVKNHRKVNEVWLVYYKKQSGQPRIPYEEAVEEALCFGWIDSLVKRIDDQKYAQKFTPRRLDSKWSDLNKERVAKLIREGRMSQVGLERISFELPQGKSPSIRRKRKDLPLSDYLAQRLMKHKKAWENFNALAPSYRRNYLAWIMSAKQEATQVRRLTEAIKLLARNEKLGLK